ncbi:MAG: GAF domain-containing protein [Methyloversatilis sp.]|uniref:GAF domain-containing protein n=1 Tax=Methyloversatilis sp. TaxID=2569862 RepID=UPI0025EDA4C1|nr:GAF domain-containing protein [Methyloversatilis sp.]MCR6665889.1 GAF domain-containing protein [Methyloversatilis sp.]
MKQPPIPENESERLGALRALLLLDTPPEKRFDRIVQFAAREFDVPIALISLVDENRQWFKSRVGLDACETSREVSFCGHALSMDVPLVIEDALLDERFADNPLVTGPPHIRFYAGAQLRLASGLVVGTLCLIDQAPRTLDEMDLGILGSLRALVVEELTARPRGAGGA